MAADFRLKPRGIVQALRRTIAANLVAHIKGSPAIGKSAVTSGVAKEFRLLMIDHRLSTSAPEDLSGLPGFFEGKAKFHPFADLFPLEGDAIPEGYEGWLLFLDELDSAPKSVQAAAYKLILDRMVGQHKLHPAVRIVTAGNLVTDRAIVNSMGTAMQSRLVHLEMIPDRRQWMDDVAIPQGYDDRIIAYLEYKKEHFYDFRADHNNHSFCAPRTWEFMNRMVKDNPVTGDDLSLFAGTISPAPAAEFIAFCTLAKDLIRVEQVENDPNGIALPPNAQVTYATVSHLLSNITNENLSKLVVFIGRLSLDFQVMFFRGLIVRHPEMRSHEGYRKGAIAIAKHLNSDD